MSALVSRFGLNERQIAFAQTYVKSGDKARAAIEAGYSHENEGDRLLRLPNVLAAVHAEMQRVLVAEAACSLQTLRELRRDLATPARVRADISLQLMKMAGHVVPTHKADTPNKQLSEMTQAELFDYIEKNQAELDRIETELAARAKDVSAQDSAQTMPIEQAKPLPFLD